MYFYDISVGENWLALTIKKLEPEIEGHRKVFHEVLIAHYLFKDGRLSGNQAIDFNHVYANSLNPEVFISYVSMMIHQKDYYENFMDWLEYTITDRNGLNENVYIYIFYLFVTGHDGIIPELLKKNMKKTLYDFLHFHYKERVIESECHAMIKISECMEEEFFDGFVRLYKTNEDYGFPLIRDILYNYGKESLDSITKFIKSMKMIHDNSLFQKKAYEQTAEILRTLCNINIAIPEHTFDSNVNYILKMVFKNYEEKISIEGFLNISKMWEDYLLMKDIRDEDYPDSVKESHDRVQKAYKGTRISKEVLTTFPEAVKEYKYLEFENSNYEVRIPKSPVEMAEVGDKLKICVGTYTTAVAKKKTQVLWLCEHNERIMALEVRNGKLIQAKTQGNHYPNAAEEEFIKEWCKEKMIDIVSY